jgi:hypothetical protein
MSHYDREFRFVCRIFHRIIKSIVIDLVLNSSRSEADSEN